MHAATPASVASFMGSNCAPSLGSQVAAVRRWSGIVITGRPAFPDPFDGQEHARLRRPFARGARMQHVRGLMAAPADAEAANLVHHRAAVTLDPA